MEQQTLSQQQASAPNPTQPAQVAPVAGGGGEVTPEMQAKSDAYVTTLMHMMHNPKTAKSVQDMLKAAPPEQSIPSVTLQLNQAAEGSFSKGGKLEDQVKLTGAMYTVLDLAEIGNTGNLWGKKLGEKDIQVCLQEVLTRYIHSGLKDGSIDPIELQAEAEKLFNDKQKEVGSSIQKEAGLPDAPTTSMGIDTYTKNKTKPLEQENQELRRLIQQQQQAQVQQRPQ